jgi:uncharacterized protein YecT (DUF1311 family)
MIKKSFVLTISLFITGFCFAQTQAEMNRQAFQDYLKTDAAMAKVYKKVRQVLTIPKQKTLLLESQRAWIKFKEAHCKSAAAMEEGGSIYPLTYSECLKELTEDRITQLNEYLKRM